MSNRIEEYEVLINGHDPTTAIKISNDSEASRTLSFIDQTKVTYRFRFNRIDHATGVITKGVELASGEALEVDLKSTDGATDFISFSNPTNTTESAAVAAVANKFEIYAHATDANIAGDYVVIPSTTGSNGVETNHLFYFALPATPPPTSTGYKVHRVNMDTTGSTLNSSLLRAAIDGLTEFTATVGSGATADIVTVTASTDGATTTDPTVSDTANLGVAFTRVGKNAESIKKYYDIVGDFGTSGSGLSYASGTTTKEAKFSVGITHASGATRKTVAVMDATVYKNFI